VSLKLDLIKKMNIMICDDDPTITAGIKKLNDRVAKDLIINISSEITHNAIDCLYKIFKDYYLGIRYDLLLIDETMPFMNGSTLTKILKDISSLKELNNITIYSITGYDDIDILNNIKSFGCDGFIKKPVKYQELKLVFEDILNQD